MAIISISITNSTESIIAGIPRFVTFEASIPSTIFYTLDGTDPTILSDIYISKLELPTAMTVTLKIFATNGTDSSPIITEIYQSNIIDGARLNPGKTNQPVGPLPVISLYPFGTNFDQNNVIFDGIEGETVLDPTLPIVADEAYDGSGNLIPQSNEPIPLSNSVFSVANDRGETGPGIGTIPYHITIQPKVPPPNESTDFSKTFDPRALVIFQSVADEDPTLPPRINRQFSVSMGNETYRDGDNFFVNAMEAQPATMQFLRQHYNPTDHTMTYYYYDNFNCRWLISKIPYTPNPELANLSTQVWGGSRVNGGQYVFEWKPFLHRILF